MANKEHIPLCEKAGTVKMLTIEPEADERPVAFVAAHPEEADRRGSGLNTHARRDQRIAKQGMGVGARFFPR